MDTEEVMEQAIAVCGVPPVEPRVFPTGFDPERAASIIVFSEKWVNGTELRYHFLEAPPDAADTQVVRDSFTQWEELPIGLRFREVSDPNEAEIRIGFDHTDGSWSYIGRQVLGRPATEPTMNFGWRLSGSAHGRDTALHEIGHTLGLPHEHQNPVAGIVWDEPAVLAHFAQPPNVWPPEKTRWNILRKIPADTVQGSDWDPDSVMHYQFARGLIREPARYQGQPLIPAGGLSPRDVTWVRTFYPPLETAPPRLLPFRSELLELTPGEQRDFLVELPSTRRYTFETFGTSDAVLVLFEQLDAGTEEDQGLRFLDGDDDSGTDLNARFEVKLFKSRRYVLRVRLYWAGATGELAVMMS